MGAPVGVFDSGVGGLTVLRALLDRLPGERFVYLGDTARLPYGTKSGATVERYSLQCARLLVSRGIDTLGVACNTASAVALPALRDAFPGLPVQGVIEPGARAAVAATRSGHVAVIATEGTVRGGAYARAIRALAPHVRVTSVACPLFVALAEEGWTDGPIVEAIARRYLGPAFDAADAPDTLVLGCTHFPVLRAALAAVLGPGIAIVDSAATTASAVAAARASVRGAAGAGDAGAHASAAGAEASASASAAGERAKLLATDGPERFARVSAVFGVPVRPEAVELVELAPAG
ncbi:MAG: glutamate racemase [Pseudomonadota bacterium]